jgi:hypothetical protein
MNAVWSTVNIIEAWLKKFWLTAKYLSAILAILWSWSGFAGDKHDEGVVHDENTAQSSDHDTHGLHATLDAGSFAGFLNRQGNPVGDPVDIIDFHAMIPVSERADLILAHEGVFGDSGFGEEKTTIGMQINRDPWLFGLYFNQYRTHELWIHSEEHQKEGGGHGWSHESHTKEYASESTWENVNFRTIQWEVSRKVWEHLKVFWGGEFVLDQDENGQPHVVYVWVWYEWKIWKKKKWDASARGEIVRTFWGNDSGETQLRLTGEVGREIFFNWKKRKKHKSWVKWLHWTQLSIWIQAVVPLWEDDDDNKGENRWNICAWVRFSKTF